MKSVLFAVIILTTIAQGCTAWHDGYSVSPDSKKNNKQIIHPPQSFIDAVFNYKKKNFRWPDQLEGTFSGKEAYQEYKTFMDKGVESMYISKATSDTLLIDLVYSRRKNAAYYGRPASDLPQKVIYGRYEFVHDSSITFFRVLLPKQKLFSVSVK